MMSLFCVAFVVLAAGSAEAGWTHELTHSRANATSVKVLEPENFKVSITVDGEARQDTVPAVFNLTDGDGFYEVTVTAPDGTTWSRKIEVKAYYQTGLRVKYTPEAAPAPAPAGPAKTKRHIGRIKNTTHKCAAKNRVELRWDFLLDGETVASRAVAPGKQDNNVEVPAGKYDLRVFARVRADQDFQFWKTDQLEVSKDGWQVQLGCGE